MDDGICVNSNIPVHHRQHLRSTLMHVQQPRSKELWTAVTALVRQQHPRHIP